MPFEPAQQPTRGRFVPSEQESVYRSDTNSIVSAPSGFNPSEIEYFDDTQNNGINTQQYFGFSKVLNSTKEIAIAPFKGAAAMGIRSGTIFRAGAEQGFSDALQLGLNFDFDEIRAKRIRGEKLTEEEARVMLRDITTRSNIFSFLFVKPRDIGFRKGQEARGKAEAIEIEARIDRLAASADRIRKKSDDFLAKNLKRPEGIVGGFFFDLGGVATSIAASIGLSVVTKSVIPSAMLFGELQKHSVYLEATDKDIDIAKKQDVSDVAKIVEGGLEFIGVHYFFKIAESSRPLWRNLGRMAEEAVQELSQSIGESFITQTQGIREKDIRGAMADALYSGFLGIFGAGGGIAVTAIADRMKKDNIDQELGLGGEIIEALAVKLEENQDVLSDIMADEIEAQASPLRDDPVMEAQTAKIMQDFAEGNDIDITALSEQDQEIFESIRDEISAAAEGQIIDIEAEEQAVFIERAKKIKEQVEAAPVVDITDPSSFKKILGRVPISITQFIKRAGGIADRSGELKARDVTPRSLPGLVRKSKDIKDQAELAGIPVARQAADNIDELREELFDAGFFPGKNRFDEITDTEIFDAIEQDIKGEKIFSQADIEEIAIIVGEDLAAKFDEIGITAGTSVEEIANILRAEEGLEPFIAVERPIAKPLPPSPPLKKTEIIDKDFVADVKKIERDNRGLVSGFLPPSVGRFFIDFGTGIERVFTPISTRIKNISPQLFVRLRRFEFNVKTKTIADHEKIKPFLQSIKRLDKDTWKALDLAMKNGRNDIIDEIAQANNMVAEVVEVRKLLDDIFDRATGVGIDVAYRSDFFPRRVKDVEGLIDHFAGTEFWNVITEAIAKKEEAIGKPLSEKEKAGVINFLMRGRSVEGISLATRGQFKERSIEKVTAETDKFYEQSDQALLSYIAIANEAIETSVLFGAPQDIDGSDQIDDSVGKFVNDLVKEGDLTSREARLLKEIFGARFNEARMGYIAAAVRDLSYIDVMGTTLNAITQFGDLTTSMYNSGIIRAASTLPGAVLGRTPVSLDDIGINSIAEEFGTGSLTSKGVNNVFKLSGLIKIDRVGKLNLINSALKKFQSQAKKNNKKLLADLELMFEEEAGQVLQDLKDGEITENVKFLVFNVLLDMQPIAKSEMPEYYLRSGNLKILYMLKTFTLRQLDIYRREVFAELNTARKTGDAKKAAKALGNFVRLAGFWIVMGASADVMKDLLRSFFGGDEIEEPEDYIIDNILKAFGFSKYQLNMVAKEGPIEVATKIFLPPAKFFTNVAKDFGKANSKKGLKAKNARTIRSIPLGGELYYFWFGGGTAQAKKESRRRGKKKVSGP